MEPFRTIEWKNKRVLIIDQRKLPVEEIYIECATFEQVAECIRNLVIRGAPAIGIAAAMGMALGALEIGNNCSYEKLKEHMKKVSQHIALTRPTAVNLFWAIGRMNDLISECREKRVEEIKNLLVTEAINIQEEDLRTCMQIGENGSELIEDSSVILTHCNAGGLATAGYGTALGVIRSAFRKGKNISVISSETRPILQGARLTTWELEREGIPVRLITDSMAGYVMSRGIVNSVVVGADRVASNGDTANKIGTYPLSILAKHHGIPFYVAAPTSTIDGECLSGEEITIEQRNPEEVTHMNGKRISAAVEVLNPAFDITPAENIECLITEAGLFRKPYSESLGKFKRKDQ
ncbi:MAG: S-methyl-5-thioribose-1-phosphate isomerase [Candidatus Dadabacteria bacterium]|nr:S-methyl-5-thioribose-1-phosphate isomerase [Candidatus Dadabacteria bacterium]MCY4263127.1 S-methyl-5-thioribose-1-phosphate isomerase [Candidatus Dadabacteria bacterium]